MLKGFKIKTDNMGRTATIYRKSIEEAQNSVIFGNVIECEELELPFKVSARIKYSEIAYYARFEKFTDLIIKAYPGSVSIEFTSRGIYALRKSLGPETIYSCKNSKEMISFVDGYWKTIELLNTAKIEAPAILNRG